MNTYQQIWWLIVGGFFNFKKKECICIHVHMCRYHTFVNATMFVIVFFSIVSFIYSFKDWDIYVHWIYLSMVLKTMSHLMQKCIHGYRIWRHCCNHEQLWVWGEFSYFYDYMVALFLYSYCFVLLIVRKIYITNC